MALPIRVFVAVAAASFAVIVLAQFPDAPRNDLPQPYRTTRDWGELPPGVKWAAVIFPTGSSPTMIPLPGRPAIRRSCAGRAWWVARPRSTSVGTSPGGRR